VPLNGVAVVSMGVGSLLLWSAVQNQKITVAAKDVVTGHRPNPGPNEIGSANENATVDSATPDGQTGDSALAAYMLAHIGTPYVSGAANPITGWDCSGAVHAACEATGTPEPPSLGSHGPVTSQWFFWSGAKTVSEADAQSGDLCCWLSHMGVYTGGGEMVSALNPERGTQETTIAGASPGPEPFRFARIQ
jgi:cell wall-associated NlpC family hydrolase